MKINKLSLKFTLIIICSLFIYFGIISFIHYPTPSSIEKALLAEDDFFLFLKKAYKGYYPINKPFKVDPEDKNMLLKNLNQDTESRLNKFKSLNYTGVNWKSGRNSSQVEKLFIINTAKISSQIFGGGITHYYIFLDKNYTIIGWRKHSI